MKTYSIPDIMLERYLLKQLPPDQYKRVRTALKTEPQLKQRLQQLQTDNLLLLKQYPVDAYREPILRQVLGNAPERLQRKAPRYALLTAAGAAMTMLLFAVGLWVILPRSPFPQVRPKGAMPSTNNCRMHLYRQRKQDMQPLFDGARVKPGERLQLAYSASVACHGVILSYDSRHQIILHFPEQRAGETRLNQGRYMSLPHSYELDQVADFERFVFITSATKISIAAVQRHLEEIIGAAAQPATAQLIFPAPLQVQSLLLYKERKP